MKNLTILISILFSSYFCTAQQQILKDDYQISFDKISYHPNQRIEIDTQLINRLNQTLVTEAAASGIKGVSCAFNFPNNEFWQGVYGEDTKDKPITIDQSFGIGSVSKSITATCILKLVEENLVALDDTIGQWIAPNPNIDPSVTIRQCLNHTSGIADILTNQSLQLAIFIDPAKIWAPDTIVAEYVPKPLFDKGTDWQYSNTNYLIAGIIIEKVTGKSYTDAVREKVLDPLGFSNIQLFPYESLNTDLTHLWNSLLEGKSLDGLFSAAWAAGAYVSTPKDISIWMKKLAKGEVLTQASMDKMLDLVVRSDNSGYGLGIVKLTNDDLTLFGHNGNISYQSSVYYIQELDLSVAIHTNDGTAKGDAIRPILTKLIQAYIGYLTDNQNITTPINFNMYPNPVSNKISIDMNKTHQEVQISITNTLGQTVASYKTNDTHFEIPVSNLVNGQYFLTIESNQNRHTNLFIKQ